MKTVKVKAHTRKLAPRSGASAFAPPQGNADGGQAIDRRNLSKRATPAAAFAQVAGYARGGLVMPEARDWQNGPFQSAEAQALAHAKRDTDQFVRDENRGVTRSFFQQQDRGAERADLMGRLGGLQTLAQQPQAPQVGQPMQPAAPQANPLTGQQRSDATFDLGINKRGQALADFRAGKIDGAQLGTINTGLSAATDAFRAVPGAPGAPGALVGATSFGTGLDLTPRLPGYWGGGAVQPVHPVPVNMKRGGPVPVASRPGKDQVPAMLDSPPGGPAEYVLPGETAQAMGGPPILDEAVRATTGKEPGPTPVPVGGKVKPGFARGGMLTPEELAAATQEQRQRAVYGQTGATVPQVGDAEMRSLPVPNTREGAQIALNMPRALPAAVAPQMRNREVAQLQPFSNTAMPEQFSMVTDTGVSVDPRGRPNVGPPTVAGMYGTAPSAAPRADGEYMRQLRMDAAEPAVRADVAQALSQPAPLVPLFNPGQARADQAADRGNAYGDLTWGTPRPQKPQQAFSAPGAPTPQAAQAFAQQRGLVTDPAVVGRTNAPGTDQRIMNAPLSEAVKAVRERSVAPVSVALSPVGAAQAAAPAAPPVQDPRFLSVIDQTRARPPLSPQDQRIADLTRGPSTAPEVLPPRVTKRTDYEGGKGIYGYDVPQAQRDEYGRAIFSDSARGATPKGLDEDIAKYGQGAAGAQDFYNGLDVSNMGAGEYQALKAQTGREEADLAGARAFYALPPNQRGAAPAGVQRAMAQGPAPSAQMGFAAEERGRAAGTEAAKLQAKLDEATITAGGAAQKDATRRWDSYQASVPRELRAAGKANPTTQDPGLSADGQAWASEALTRVMNKAKAMGADVPGPDLIQTYAQIAKQYIRPRAAIIAQLQLENPKLTEEELAAHADTLVQQDLAKAKQAERAMLQG